MANHDIRIFYGIVAIGTILITALVLNMLYFAIVLGAPEGETGALIPLHILFPAAILTWPVIYGLGMLLERLEQGLDGWTT